MALLLAALLCWSMAWSAAINSAFDPLLVAVNVVFWLPVFGIVVGTMPEWTVVGGELSRRTWRSWPGRKPTKVMDLSPEVEIVHETRYRWRIHPAGLVIRTWPFPWAATGFIAALEHGGVRVDDFRGDWQRQHRALDALAMLAYVGAFACLLSTPAIGFLFGIGLPLTPAIVAGVLAAVGEFVDRGPWRAARL
ncbi:MAG TPA: hypothetical protein VF337_10580 [Candidatus Limnocylindrales bacterium]